MASLTGHAGLFDSSVLVGRMWIPTASHSWNSCDDASMGSYLQDPGLSSSLRCSEQQTWLQGAPVYTTSLQVGWLLTHQASALVPWLSWVTGEREPALSPLPHVPPTSCFQRSVLIAVCRQPHIHPCVNQDLAMPFQNGCAVLISRHVQTVHGTIQLVH